MARPLLARALLSLLAGLLITLALSAAIALHLTPRGTPTTRVTFELEHPYHAGWLMTTDHAGLGWTHRARSLVAPQSYGTTASSTGSHITLTLDAPEAPDPIFPIALPPRATAATLEYEPSQRLLYGATPGGTLPNWPFQMRTGWPARSMAYWIDGVTGWSPFGWATTNRPRALAWGREIGTPPANLLFPHRVIPLEPLWPGLLINTLLWAAPIFALFVALPHLRRARRQRRNQCTRCAYPLTNLPACPECGHPAPTHPTPVS